MTLYDRNGMSAAYTDSDGEHIYLLDGRPTAYLNKDTTYGSGGIRCGWFEKGWVRGLDGYCVTFMGEARTQEPAKPSRHKAPAKWARAARPMRRFRETKHSKIACKMTWSEIAAGDSLFGNS